MLAQILACIAVLSVANAKLFSEDKVHQKFLWDDFKLSYGRNYASQEEETLRFGHFLANLKIADERNAAERAVGGGAQHGITKFFDLHQDEFENKMLKSDPTKKVGDAEVATISGEVNVSAGLVDWSGKLTTPVKDQGYCGSCWAFSAAEQIESDSMRTLGTSYILSPEQIVQCDNTSYGCSGGFTENAYKYVKKAGGIETNSAYPYTSYQGVTGRCASVASSFVIGVTSFYTIKGESAMATYVQNTGPLSVCVDASTWNSYTGGIMKSCGKRVDHCVQAVGVDASSSGYWKVRNSWSTSWGESGYIRLAYGANTCAITNDPTYVAVTKK